MYIFLMGVIITQVDYLRQSAVDEVIERMDEHYLSKEDWDTVVELGVDEHREEFVMKKISAPTKGALTRKYVISLLVLRYRVC